MSNFTREIRFSVQETEINDYLTKINAKNFIGSLKKFYLQLINHQYLVIAIEDNGEEDLLELNNKTTTLTIKSDSNLYAL